MSSPTILMVAGHGLKPDGTNDPGAFGYIPQGENAYMKQVFFPAMKKFTPKNAGIVYFTQHNTYAYQDIDVQAKKYGSDTIVVEMHFDAAGSKVATGGHVIVYEGYSPDKIDLSIRDAIKKNVGVVYSHRGEMGVSGRSDLYNCNKCASKGINYRLVELGFGTNQTDANHMLNHVDQYAKDMVEALIGESTNAAVSSKNNQTQTSKTIENKSIDTLAKEVIQGHHGSGEVRKANLGSKYNVVQDRVNQILSDKNATGSRSIEQVAKDAIAGKYGNGEQRKQNIKNDGYNYETVQAKVNELLKSTKSTETIAKEVIAGKWGNGASRRNKLIAAGYNYEVIQAKVNQLI